MIEKESIPFAPSLVESMRSLGYSFEYAIADLIDNSISAQSTKIDLYMMSQDNPYIIIFDNGYGMTNSEIQNAMRYGSSNPLDERSSTDLGRFGLGLKSASLSQCRNLVVVSKKNNQISAYSWDIDVIIEKKGWILLEYNKQEIEELPLINLFDNVDSGTYVLLRKFDRISKSTKNLNSTLISHMDYTIDHIALVFHRFLNNGVEIFVNNEKVEPRDPFLTSHRSTQLKREQIFRIKGEEITVKPYILPYITKLSHDDLRKVGGKEDLKKNQGFYIYRNKRLIIWGTWFRLTRKDELTKLARIKVDIPSSLDYMWNIDIKKSSANLPDIIKKQLYNCIDESTQDSKSTNEYRGRRIKNNKDIEYIWDIVETREGNVYRINRNLAQIEMLCSKLSKSEIKLLDNILKNIEESFPSETLYLDVAKGNHNKSDSNNLDEEYYLEFKSMLDYALDNGLNVSKIYKNLINQQPYSNNEYVIQKIKGEYFNEL